MNVGFDNPGRDDGIIRENLNFQKVAHEYKAQKGLAGNTRRVVYGDFGEPTVSKSGFFSRLVEWFKPSALQKTENKDTMSAFKEYLVKNYGESLTSKLCPDIDKSIEKAKPLSARMVAKVLDHAESVKVTHQRELALAQKQELARVYSSRVLSDPKQLMPLTEGTADKLYLTYMVEEDRNVRTLLGKEVQNALLDPEKGLTGSPREMQSQAQQVSKKMMLAGMFSSASTFEKFTSTSTGQSTATLFPSESEKINSLDLEDRKQLGSDIADAILKKEAEVKGPVSDEDLRLIVNDLFYKALGDSKNKPLAIEYAKEGKILEIMQNLKPRNSDEMGLKSVFNRTYQLMSESQKQKLSNAIYEAIFHHGGSIPLDEKDCLKIVLDQCKLASDKYHQVN